MVISRCIFATRFDIHIPRLVDILSLSLDALQLAPLRRIIPHGLEYRLGSYSTNGGYIFLLKSFYTFIYNDEHRIPMMCLAEVSTLKYLFWKEQVRDDTRGRFFKKGRTTRVKSNCRRATSGCVFRESFEI